MSEPTTAALFKILATRGKVRATAAPSVREALSVEKVQAAAKVRALIAKTDAVSSQLASLPSRVERGRVSATRTGIALVTSSVQTISDLATC